MGAAGNGNGVRGNAFQSWGSNAHMIDEREFGGFFDAQAPAADAAIGQSCRGDLCGAFILLPDANFIRETDFLSQPAFLKGRNDEDGLPGGREQQSEQALAAVPTDA